MTTKAHTRKIVSVTILLVFIIGIGLVLQNNSKQQDTTTTIVPTVTPTPIQDLHQRITLEGKVICLPLINPSSSVNEDCHFAVQTNEGENYLLDTGLMSSIPPKYKKGDRIRANGMITPAEALSTDKWHIYKMKGIFSASDSLIIIQ